MPTPIEKDVVLIGAGIMSATLGTLLHSLEPTASIAIFERLDRVAQESSDAWNNAGTGHSGFCELNYTPQNAEGKVEVDKALKIASSYEVSKQFWAYLIRQKVVKKSYTFLREIPHISFVWGEENVSFLRERWETLQAYALFQRMQYQQDSSILAEWMPLVMEGRTSNVPLAATKVPFGNDVNFGALTRFMIQYLEDKDHIELYLGKEIVDIERQADGRWLVTSVDMQTKEKLSVLTKFVFIGAGGGAVTLLAKSDIPEGKGYGGFPVSGIWLKCLNKDIIKKHHAKVYGKAEIGAPPMSVPHLDSRWIDGQKALLFGPYAGFSTKFLKEGSYLDLPLSIELDNIRPMISAGLQNIPLTKYLIKQVMQSDDDRLEALRKYYPAAKKEDWEVAIAGQRVQIIKHDEEDGGILEFGTEIVASADGSLAALLGASPGASTSVRIMLDVLKRCFPEKYGSNDWQDKILTMMPCLATDLIHDENAVMDARAFSNKQWSH